MKDETQSCLTPRSWSWPLRQDASLQLEQVKEELSPGGVRGEAKGLTLNKPYFPRSRETEQIASIACGNLLGFFFLLETTFVQAGLPAWRTGREGGTNSHLRACWLHTAKWSQRKITIPDIKDSQDMGWCKRRGRGKEETQNLFTCTKGGAHLPTDSERWPDEDWSKRHILQERIRGNGTLKLKGQRPKRKITHQGGWHSPARCGLDIARSMWLEKCPKARSSGQEIKGPGSTDVAFYLYFQLRIQPLREDTECERKKKKTKPWQSTHLI